MTKDRRDQLKKVAMRLQTKARDSDVGALAGIVMEILDDVELSEPVLVREYTTHVKGFSSLFDSIFGKFGK